MNCVSRNQTSIVIIPLHFALVGDGPSLQGLKATAAARCLDDVSFLPHQLYELVPDIYASSDLCVVSLREAVVEGALPSEVPQILACGRLILAICDPESDLGHGHLARDLLDQLYLARHAQSVRPQKFCRSAISTSFFPSNCLSSAIRRASSLNSFARSNTPAPRARETTASRSPPSWDGRDAPSRSAAASSRP